MLIKIRNFKCYFSQILFYADPFSFIPICLLKIYLDLNVFADLVMDKVSCRFTILILRINWVISAQTDGVKYFRPNLIFYGVFICHAILKYLDMQDIGIISVIEAEASRARGHSGHEAPPMTHSLYFKFTQRMYIRGLRTPYVHNSLCFPLSPGHNMVIFQEYQIFNFFSSQFAWNFWTYFLEGKILKSYMKSLRM